MAGGLGFVLFIDSPEEAEEDLDRLLSFAKTETHLFQELYYMLCSYQMSLPLLADYPIAFSYSTKTQGRYFLEKVKRELYRINKCEDESLREEFLANYFSLAHSLYLLWPINVPSNLCKNHMTLAVNSLLENGHQNCFERLFNQESHLGMELEPFTSDLYLERLLDHSLFLIEVTKKPFTPSFIKNIENIIEKQLDHVLREINPNNLSVANARLYKEIILGAEPSLLPRFKTETGNLLKKLTDLLEIV